MSTYQRLRPYYALPPDERISMMCAEMAAPLSAARAAIDELQRFEPAQLAGLFGGRYADLAAVLRASLPQLAHLIDTGPGMCERARAAGGLSDHELHVYRHDLLTPLGNVSGVAKLLVRVVDAAPPDFARYAQALNNAARELIDIVDALTASHDRG